MAQPKNKSDEPIPGPKPVGPEYIFEPDPNRPMNILVRYTRFVADLVRKPVHWIKANIVEPNKGPKYYWYHKRYPRVLPIDECYIDDQACVHEANLEYKRNHLVDKFTLDLLRYRRDSCNYWNSTLDGHFKNSDNCKEVTDTYDRESTNFFIKYGDMHAFASVIHVYAKQKHRMIMERRIAERKAREAAEMPNAAQTEAATMEAN